VIPQPLRIDPAWLPAGVELPKGRAVVRFSAAERRVMRKKRPMACSEWAERHRVVPSDAAIPGRWRNSTTQYLTGIMDASFFESVQHITICAPPQTGKSEAINNCIAYACDRRPGNVLMVYPDETTGRENMRDRLLPMIQDSDRLRSFMTAYSDDASSMRIQLQHMRVYLAWANSAARLANKPLPYVVLDEEDKYPKTAGKREASPSDLARKRQRTFAHMRKMWRASSPSIEAGPIWQALTTDAELRFDSWVRCPHCNGFQIMVFEQIKWPDDCRCPVKIESRKLAWYECDKCHGHWSDADRDQAVRNGEWRCTATGMSIEARLKQVRPKKIGFHIPSWISRFVSMSEAAASFLAGLKDNIIFGGRKLVIQLVDDCHLLSFVGVY
jgi:phage terminase large subunit GpA-like protein